MPRTFARVRLVQNFGTHLQDCPTIRKSFQHGILLFLTYPLIKGDVDLARPLAPSNFHNRSVLKTNSTGCRSGACFSR